MASQQSNCSNKKDMVASSPNQAKIDKHGREENKIPSNDEQEMVASSPPLLSNDEHGRHEDKIQSNDNKKEQTVEITQPQASVHQNIADKKSTGGENASKETVCTEHMQGQKPSHVTSSKMKKEQDEVVLPNLVNNPYISSATKQSLPESNTTVVPTDNISAATPVNIMKNPYVSSLKRKTQTKNAEENGMQTQHSAIPRMPEKHQTPNINIMNTGQKKNKNLPRTTRMSLKVEGYAFHDDIVGVAHLKQNGEEAFNLTLRNMIYARELEDEGFSSYVSLRDKSSGKKDLALLGDDQYPKYLFLSINVHHFSSIEEAAPVVMEQCEKLHSVSVTCQ